MDQWSFLFLDLVAAVVLQPYLWLALIVVQVLNLIVGVETHRWLPAGLLVIGFTWCLISVKS
jgi:hypothetical protein